MFYNFFFLIFHKSYVKTLINNLLTIDLRTLYYIVFIIINIKPVKFILEVCEANRIIGDPLFDLINLQIKKKKNQSYTVQEPRN